MQTLKLSIHKKKIETHTFLSRISIHNTLNAACILEL